MLRNSLFTMGTTAGTAALGYLYWTFAARLYSAEAVGLSSALISVMGFCSSVATLGLDATLIHRLPGRAPGRAWSATVNAALVLSGVAAFVGGLFLVAALPVLSDQFAPLRREALLALAFAVGVVITTNAALLDAAFTAERSTGYKFVRNVAFALVKIPPLLAFAVAAGLAGSLAIFGSWVAASVAAVGFGVYLLRRLGREHRWAITDLPTEIRTILPTLAPNYLTNLGGMAPMWLLPVWVTLRLSTEDNAYFYTTWMLGSLFFMVAPAVAMSLFAEGSHDGTQLRQKVRASAGIIAALMLPTMVFFLLFGEHLLRIFGAQYASEGRTLLVLLTVSAIPDAITSVSVSVLRIRRRFSAAACLNLGMAGFALVLGWVLLPPLGIAGAGLAWLLAQTAGCLAVAATVIRARRFPGHQRTTNATRRTDSS